MCEKSPNAAQSRGQGRMGTQTAPPDRQIPRLWPSWNTPVPSSSLTSLSRLLARGVSPAQSSASPPARGQRRSALERGSGPAPGGPSPRFSGQDDASGGRAAPGRSQALPGSRGSAAGRGAVPAAAPITSAREDAAAAPREAEERSNDCRTSPRLPKRRRTLPTGLDGGLGSSSRPAARPGGSPLPSALPGASTGSCSGTRRGRTPRLPAPAPIYSFNCCVQEPSLSHNPPGKAQRCPKRLRA